MKFETLGLSPAILRALAALDYAEPTPIQSAAIPVVLAGRDLLAAAQTGTGKTAGFALPLLERLFPGGERGTARRSTRPRALVLVPTRELAMQVHDALRDFARHINLNSTTIFGGVGMGPQLQKLARGVDVLIATPGRLIDHLERGSADLSGIEMLVLDEADRMLDMGFLPALKRILAKIPASRQTLLFSATFAAPIKALAMQFLKNPEEVSVARANTVVASVDHRVHAVDAERKRDLLLHLLAEDSRRQTLVFARTKHGADKLVKFLSGAGLRTAAIHGNKSQNQRTRALADFKDGRITVLVATDIAARGIDIVELPLVINHDLPNVAEDYVHRIGRTGRAGASGLAISLVTQDEAPLLRDIQTLLKQEVAIFDVAGFEPNQPLRINDGARPRKAQANKPQPRRGAPRKSDAAQPAAKRRSRRRGPRRASTPA